MITILTTARPFRGHFGIIQRNAVESWTRLSPRPQILLLGSEEGYAEVARDFGITWVPEVESNEYGTPLLSSMIEVADRLAHNDVMLLIAADTILFDDTIEAAKLASNRFSRFCVITGRRHAKIVRRIDFDSADWQQKLMSVVTPTGEDDVLAGDYFLHSKGLWRGMPPFAIGRTVADNWMFHHARATGAALIDATRAVFTIHQDHDYSHHPDGANGVFHGAEAVANRALLQSSSELETQSDANWILTAEGFRRPALRNRLVRRLRRLRQSLRRPPPKA